MVDFPIADAGLSSRSSGRSAVPVMEVVGHSFQTGSDGTTEVDGTRTNDIKSHGGAEVDSDRGTAERVGAGDSIGQSGSGPISAGWG